jgi:tripartite-type tricarboxylate transporter receptor subunit TctC
MRGRCQAAIIPGRATPERAAVCSEIPAAAYPQTAGSPVRLIEPFGSGGGPDIVARAITAPLSERWGRQVDVENHPGGGSTAAPALVAKAPADGDTLLVNTSAHAYSAAVPENLPYDPLRDFVAVTPLTSQAYVFVAGRRSGISSLAELVAAAKAGPGAMKFGSTGVGTGTHLGTEELNLAAGIRAAHVPAGPHDSISDVVARVVRGAVDYAMSPISIAGPYVADGTLVALGVTSEGRSPALPDVATIAEAGLAGYDFSIWYGVWAPVGTPRKVVERLGGDISSAIARPDVHDRLVNHGMNPMSLTPEAFGRFVLDEKRWAAQIIDRSRTSA